NSTSMFLTYYAFLFLRKMINPAPITSNNAPANRILNIFVAVLGNKLPLSSSDSSDLPVNDCTCSSASSASPGLSSLLVSSVGPDGFVGFVGSDGSVGSVGTSSSSSIHVFVMS